MPNRAGSRGLARANRVRGWIDGCTCMFLWLRASGREKKKEIKTRWEGLRKLTQKKGRKSDKERNEWWSALETHPRTCTGIYVLIRHTVAVHVRPPAAMTGVHACEWARWLCGWRDAATVHLILPSVWSLQPPHRSFSLRYFKPVHMVWCQMQTRFQFCRGREADNDSSGFQIPEKCNDLFYERNGYILMYGTAQHKKGSFSYSCVGNDFSS